MLRGNGREGKAQYKLLSNGKSSSHTVPTVKGMVEGKVGWCVWWWVGV